MAEDAPPDDTPAKLAALRSRGAARADPVRLHFLEALARREGAHQGQARQTIAGRLAELSAAFAADLEKAAATGDAPAPQAGSPLATLVGELARRSPRPEPAGEAPASSAERELDYVRRTWSRLAADQRIAQSRAALPGNAGPLNSQNLVHRALTAMRELSPAYFERFVTHVDALQWVARANAADDLLGAARAGRAKAD